MTSIIIKNKKIKRKITRSERNLFLSIDTLANSHRKHIRHIRDSFKNLIDTKQPQVIRNKRKKNS